jgi:citronellyl-CoA dehydrogenase
MQYTHEHLEIQKTLQTLHRCRAHQPPRGCEWEAEEMFPAHDVFKGLGQLGLLGLTSLKPLVACGTGLLVFGMLMAEALGLCPLRWHAHGHRGADRHVHAGAGAVRQR